MKRFKKIAKITGFSFLGLLLILILVPYLFKPQLVKLLKKELNSQLNAKVDFNDLSLSFIRHFPKASVTIEDLYVANNAPFEGDTLFKASAINLSLNLMSVIKGENMTIYSVKAEKPVVNAIVHRDGTANWNITKSDSSTKDTSTSALKLNLEEYEITDGTIVYDDESSNMLFSIEGLQHQGKGGVNGDEFKLSTTSDIKALTYKYGGIPFLFNTKTKLKADFTANTATSTFGYDAPSIELNALPLTSKGSFQIVNDSSYKMDLQLQSAKSDFKNFLSLIPAIYAKDFESIKTSGTASLGGNLKGIYSPQSMPAFHVNLNITNGMFQYPDLPAAVKNIQLDAKVDNPDGVPDNTAIAVSKGHIELDKDPFDFEFGLTNPMTAKNLIASVKGSVNLASITQFVKLEAGTVLKGLLKADVDARGSMAGSYDKILVKGGVDMTNFEYSSKTSPDPINLQKLLANFSNTQINIAELSGKYMGTAFNGTGSIIDPLAYFNKKAPLKGNFTINADQFNVNKWMGTSTDTATTTASEPFAVPSDIKFTLNAGVNKITYDKLEIDNASGTLEITDETVFFKNLKGNALQGSMNINGSYSTLQSKSKPDIALTYDVKNVDVQQTFFAFNTFQKIMPIGQFLGGKLQSQLSVKGQLGENLFPVLNSLNGKGDLLLIEGFLSKFKPLEEIASQLKIKELESISVKDVKNYIEFTNGRVMVKPFKLNVKGIEMEIGGFHGFDQSMDYQINMKVPRSMLGTQANSLVSNWESQLSAKGIPVKASTIVPILVKVGGSLSKPQIKTSIKEGAQSLADDLKQQVTDFAKAKVDSTKAAVTKAVKDSVESAKKQVVDAAKSELKKQLLGDTATKSDPSKTKKQLEEAGKGLFKQILGKKKKDSTSN